MTAVHSLSQKILSILGLFFLCSEIAKQILLTVIYGHYNWWYFPFQLCSLPIYLLPALHFSQKPAPRRCILTFLSTYNMLGGIAAFLDTSGMHYPVALLTVHSYLWHILLIITGLWAGICLFTETISDPSLKKWSCRDFFKATLVFLAACAVAEAINLAVCPFGSINMFYINPKIPMEQIVFDRIAGAIGNTPAIFLYILTIIAVAFAFYILWQGLFQILIKKRGQRHF